MLPLGAALDDGPGVEPDPLGTDGLPHVDVRVAEHEDGARRASRGRPRRRSGSPWSRRPGGPPARRRAARGPGRSRAGRPAGCRRRRAAPRRRPRAAGRRPRPSRPARRRACPRPRSGCPGHPRAGVVHGDRAGRGAASVERAPAARTGAVRATGSPSSQKPRPSGKVRVRPLPVLEDDDVLTAGLLDPHDGADPAGGDLLDDEAGLGGLRAAGAGGSVVRRAGAPEHVRAVAVVVHPGSLGARSRGRSRGAQPSPPACRALRRSIGTRVRGVLPRATTAHDRHDGGGDMSEDRRLDVLRAIVEDYVATKEPVGSRALVERHSLGVSPATIRNDMAALEEGGYIAQPHTSAGRVPTDKGYRLFVDQLSTVKPLSSPERRAIGTFLETAQDLDDVVDRAVRLIAQLTQQVAVVQYPSLRRSALRHVELVPVGPRHLLVVLITDTGPGRAADPRARSRTSTSPSSAACAPASTSAPPAVASPSCPWRSASCAEGFAPGGPAPGQRGGRRRRGDARAGERGAGGARRHGQPGARRQLGRAVHRPRPGGARGAGRAPAPVLGDGRGPRRRRGPDRPGDPARRARRDELRDHRLRRRGRRVAWRASARSARCAWTTPAPCPRSARWPGT